MIMENIINNMEKRQMHFPVLNPLEDFESWHFSIKLENGELVKIRFSINENYNVPVKSSASIWIIDENFNEINEKLSVKYDDASFGEKNCNIKVGDSWCINHGEYYEIYLKINGNGIHVKLYPKFQGWWDKNGVINTNIVGTSYFGWNFPISYAKVDGVLLKENKEIKVKGYGTMDHCWGNDNLGKEMLYLIIGTFFFDDNVWVFYVGKSHEGDLVVKIVGIDKEGVKYNFEDNCGAGNVNVQFTNFNDQIEVFPKFPQLINIKSIKNNFNLNLKINEIISKEKRQYSRIKAHSSADFKTEVILDIKQKNLKKTYKTRTVCELHSFKKNEQ